MSEFIDRDRLEVVGYQGVPEGYENTFDCGVMWLLEQIDEMPSSDVVGVVRCRDCAKAQKDAVFGGIYCKGIRRDDDFYCRDGEKDG